MESSDYSINTEDLKDQEDEKNPKILPDEKQLEEDSSRTDLRIMDDDDDYSNRFDDRLWEHQDLIEQLKIEMNKVRAIMSSSESLRIMEELKPWEAIDERFHYDSSTTSNDLPKFFTVYKERMRKFDILNFQKLYAIGSLRLNILIQSFLCRENTPRPIIKSFLFCLRRGRRSEPESSQVAKNFMREFYGDLETVYVGQLCLSWEVLKWQYEKVLLLLWQGSCEQCRLLIRYNEIAQELQQFQVLLQRFIENEDFQGPRVENYARNRFSMPNLLQVPFIREDKGKYKEREEDEDGITIEMLLEILEESIRTIWNFIRADKDASSLIHKGQRENQNQNQRQLVDPVDSELLVEIVTQLHKKEKRFGEILKSRNCILKKFHQKEEEEKDLMNPFFYFFCQVDMKLVTRVLNMSKISKDQLSWCLNKLNNINFVNRNIHVESSFLLFPCS
ncbi:hypothetical protein PIB30_017955 [Stylosanthes scabra]|uniref:Uncharacterized protein n=1 Tax=Stylosanthes scabra TaxID=79078 RepID=A0ABU6S7T6_9FABA|nr:hypothetical protein [Stylosanthes scabra]